MLYSPAAQARSYLFKKFKCFFIAGAVAWDTVEELSAAVAHKKVTEQPMDVLDKFCNVSAHGKCVCEQVIASLQRVLRTHLCEMHCPQLAFRLRRVFEQGLRGKRSDSIALLSQARGVSVLAIDRCFAE